MPEVCKVDNAIAGFEQKLLEVFVYVEVAMKQESQRP